MTTLQKQRTQVEQIANQIITDPIDGYNKPLPKFDFDKMTGSLPEEKGDAHVPIIVEIGASDNTTHSGDGEDWVGQSKLAINWLQVKFVLPSFNRPTAPLVLKYKVQTKLGTRGGDAVVTDWLLSTNAFKAGRIYAIHFMLDGTDKDLYDVEYKGRLENGTETQPGRNGNGIANVPGDLNNESPPGYAISQLQLRIISKPHK